MKAWSVQMYEWTWYICIYLYLYKQYFNWWRWHQRKSEKCSHSLSSCICVCMSLHYFLSLFTEEDVETRNKRNEDQTVCICMYVCLWPIGIVYMHVVHTNINGISLCYRHNRPTKNRRIRRKGRESTSFFIYRQTPIEAKKGEKENICQIYAPLCSCSVYWRWYQMLPMLPPLLAAVYEQIEAWVP
jgi:hypothetical protein